MPVLSTLGAAIANVYGFTSGLIKDQYFNLVSLLLPGNGTNGAQNNTFLDGSSNNFTITRNGNTTQGTFSPFSQTGWGNYFNGSSNYRLTIPDSTDLDIAGDFCLEFWVYFLSQSASNQLVCIGNENAAQNGFILYNSSATPSEISLYTNGATAITTSSAGVTTNRWHHIALVRNGAGAGNTVIYVDGVSRGSAQITTSFTGLAGNGLSIGQTYNGSYVGVLNAYLSNVRLVNGSPVYTGAFTPPTSPLTAITNTVLLTCQSNRFVDTNTQTTAKTITVTGSPSVTPFSPFAPTSSYSAAAVGGSGYFDGSGDYLDLGGSSDILPTTGNFTVETWVYVTSTSSSTAFYFRGNTSSYSALRIVIESNQILMYMSTTGSSHTVNSGYVGTVPINSWNHIAVTRNSGTITIYVNGTSVYTSTALAEGTALMTGSYNYIGAYLNPGIVQTFNGYISSLRVVSGTAVYTGAFTPPSLAPLTTAGSTSAAAYSSTTNVNTSFASSATSLLLNFTNAGVVDATAKNVLETVGNAQISTSVSKFGGGSIYVDGTGDGLFSDASPTINAMTLGTGDFCIEFWVYFNSLSGTPNLLDMRPVATQGVYPSMYVDTSKVSIYVNSATLITGTTTMSTGQWYHIAWSRISGQSALYVGGTRQGASSTADTNNYLCSRVVFGIDRGLSANPVNGYFDDIRITKGNGRGYTGASITVPTAPFPVQ